MPKRAPKPRPARPASPAPTPTPQIVPLRADYDLVVSRSPGQDIVTLVSRSGAVHLRIGISDAGAEVSLEGASLSLRTTGDLAIDADRVHLHARRELALTTDGQARLEAKESVKIDGLEIYLNS